MSFFASVKNHFVMYSKTVFNLGVFVVVQPTLMTTVEQNTPVLKVCFPLISLYLFVD